MGVNPGPVATGRVISLMQTQARIRFGDEERYPEVRAGLPFGRAAEPREIADMIAFLAC